MATTIVVGTCFDCCIPGNCGVCIGTHRPNKFIATLLGAVTSIHPADCDDCELLSGGSFEILSNPLADCSYQRDFSGFCASAGHQFDMVMGAIGGGLGAITLTHTVNWAFSFGQHTKTFPIPRNCFEPIILEKAFDSAWCTFPQQILLEPA